MKIIITSLTALLLGLLISCNQNSGKRDLASPEFRFEEFTIEQLQQDYANGDFTVTDVLHVTIESAQRVFN